MPKVSVVIPTYNRAHLISETVQNVLAQNFRDYEVIVVDDGSTDNTKDVLRPFGNKIKYIYKKNAGLAAARNTGIEHSTGEYIAFIDDDDLWYPNKLDVQVGILDKNLQLGFVCSQADVINAQSGEVMYTLKKGWFNKENFESLYNENFIPVLTVMMRRSCYEKLGGFDENQITGEDYDYWLRLSKIYPFHFIDMPLAKWRMTPKSMSKNIEKMFEGNWRALNKEETIKDMSRLRVMIRQGTFCLEYAGKYLEEKHYSKAAKMYFKSLISFPFIGLVVWTPELSKKRFTFPYRLLRIYGLMFYCLFMYCLNLGSRRGHVAH
jgi:glycosyltransferase involved in cell wall biosynthesis